MMEDLKEKEKKWKLEAGNPNSVFSKERSKRELKKIQEQIKNNGTTCMYCFKHKVKECKMCNVDFYVIVGYKEKINWLEFYLGVLEFEVRFGRTQYLYLNEESKKYHLQKTNEIKRLSFDKLSSEIKKQIFAEQI